MFLAMASSSCICWTPEVFLWIVVAIKKSDIDGKLFKVRQVGGLISNDYVESGFPYFLQDQASDQMTADHNQLILDCLACVYHIPST